LEIFGKEMTVEQVFLEIVSDEVFYRNSGGGITVSGGEPLTQTNFVAELFQLCRQNAVSTALDTCGVAIWEEFEKVLPNTDLVLYDLKQSDPRRHGELTGMDNRLILENLQKLSDYGYPVIIRIPIVPSLNDTTEVIEDIIRIISSKKTIQSVSLLPFHRLGWSKLRRLGVMIPAEIADLKPPKFQRMEEIKSQIEAAGFQVNIGQ
jgi:pyruvate formate lyase activating enzyme